MTTWDWDIEILCHIAFVCHISRSMKSVWFVFQLLLVCMIRTSVLY